GGLLNDLDSLPDRIAVSNRCVLAMRELGLPTIAKVSGVAAGSGANLALACDFVVADERARFAQLFIHRGLSLDSGASWLLPRLVGERKARNCACWAGPCPRTRRCPWGCSPNWWTPHSWTPGSRSWLARWSVFPPRRWPGPKGCSTTPGRATWPGRCTPRPRTRS